MKDILFNYYDLNIENINSYGDNYLFFIDGKKYYLMKTDYDEKRVNLLDKEIKMLHGKNIMVHTLVKNKNDSYISNGYILMKVNAFGDDISLYDIKLFNSIESNKIKNYVNMNDFWYRKLDYLEKQRYELSTNNLINNSFDYFLGVSELLLKNLSNNYGNTRITLSHKSLNSIKVIDYYNPFNIVYDVWLKDIGYYIKYTHNYVILDDYIDKINKYELNYLFTRLCFPFEYFNEVSDILVDNKQERSLLNIVNRIDLYEKHLFNMEHIFNIYLFKWLKK